MDVKAPGTNPVPEFNSLPESRKRRMLELERIHSEEQQRYGPYREYCRGWRLNLRHVYELGSITIIEATDPLKAAPEFAIFVDGKDQHTSATSLDQALIVGLCVKYGAENAAYWIGRMIGMVKPKD